MTNLDISRKKLLREKEKERFGLIDVLLILLLVVMVSNIIVQTYVLAPVKVDGNSMNLTLQNGDWLFMSKIKEPERGDVVVFEKTRNINYIKRIILERGVRKCYNQLLALLFLVFFGYLNFQQL